MEKRTGWHKREGMGICGVKDVPIRPAQKLIGLRVQIAEKPSLWRSLHQKEKKCSASNASTRNRENITFLTTSFLQRSFPPIPPVGDPAGGVASLWGLILLSHWQHKRRFHS